MYVTKRSILFVAVTAEEKGLLGSDYYAQNPTVPVEQMVANVNLDMPLILYPIGDVIAFGAEHSTMGDFDDIPMVWIIGKINFNVCYIFIRVPRS